MARRLEVVIESRHCAHVRGYGSRDLLTELRGRPPIYSTLTRAWVTTETTARDLIAVAESRGYEVLLTGSPVSPSSSTRRADDGPDDDHLVHPGGQDLDLGRGLW